MDNTTGTASNDTILGTVSLTNVATPVLGGSYNVFDTINGNTGTDTLSITVTGGGTTVANASTIPAATISGIEAVTIRNTATGSTTGALNDAGVTYAGSTGINTYTSDRSTDFVAFTNVASGSTIAVNGTGTTTTAQGATSATFATGATTATVRFSNGTGTSGADNSGDVTIGSGLTSLTVESTGAANAAGTLTTSNATNTTAVTINATANLTLAALTGYSTASAASLTVTGAGLVTITGAQDATLDTITATNNTGGVSVTLGAGTTAFTGGSGNDTVNTAALSVTAAIAGGEGTDTAVFTASTNYATTATKLTGFETLAVRSAAGGDAYDYSLISGLTGIQVESAGTTTFNNVGATTPIRVTNNVTTALAVNLASTTGSSDAVSITIDDRDTTAAAITVGAISAAGVETLNIVSGDTLTAGTPHVISALTSSTGLTTINVSGTSDLTITDATVPTGALTIDGSSMTTRLTVGAAATSGISAGDTVKGGSAVDNLFINFAGLSTTTGFQAGAGDDTLTVIGNGSDIVDGDFAAITGVDNLTVTSTTGTTVTMGGFAQAAIATVDANTDGRLDFTATGLTTASTIDGSALTSRGVDYVVTITNANGGGGQALAVSGGSIADTFTITADDTADADDDDNLTVSITGGNGIDTISLTRTLADAADVATIVMTATSLANSDIITGFTANSAAVVIDYNGTVQGTVDTDLTSNATLAGALATASRSVYVQTTDIANSGSNTQGSAFAAVLGSSATTLAANYAALEEQLLATGGALNGTITGLDAAIANNTASLIVLDNGTGSVVLRLLNTTTVANTITAAEIDLVAVLTNAVGLTALDFV